MPDVMYNCTCTSLCTCVHVLLQAISHGSHDDSITLKAVERLYQSLNDGKAATPIPLSTLKEAAVEYLDKCVNYQLPVHITSKMNVLYMYRQALYFIAIERDFKESMCIHTYYRIRHSVLYMNCIVSLYMYTSFCSPMCTITTVVICIQ